MKLTYFKSTGSEKKPQKTRMFTYFNSAFSYYANSAGSSNGYRFLILNMCPTKSYLKCICPTRKIAYSKSSLASNERCIVYLKFLCLPCLFYSKLFMSDGKRDTVPVIG